MSNTFRNHCDAFTAFEKILIRLGGEQETIGLILEAGLLPSAEQLLFYNSLLLDAKDAFSKVTVLNPNPEHYSVEGLEMKQIDEDARKKRRGF